MSVCIRHLWNITIYCTSVLGATNLLWYLTSDIWTRHATELFQIFDTTFVTAKLSMFYNFDKIQADKIFISILNSVFICLLLGQYLTCVHADKLSFRNIVQATNAPSTIFRFEHLKKWIQIINYNCKLLQLCILDYESQFKIGHQLTCNRNCKGHCTTRFRQVLSSLHLQRSLHS